MLGGISQIASWLRTYLTRILRRHPAPDARRFFLLLYLELRDALQAQEPACSASAMACAVASSANMIEAWRLRYSRAGSSTS